MSRASRSARGGWTLTELMVVLVASAAVSVTLMQDALRARRHQAELAGHADDLRVAVDACDLLAREVRVARALAARTPGGAVRLGARALVARGPDGRVTALTLEGDGPRRRLVRTVFGPSGRRLGREDLGAVGDLTLRFDAAQADAVTAVMIEVRLPARGGAGAPPVLATRALVGGEVAR
ncbi:MAG: hypothetical protein KF878_31755 [Planctomycetes bacterium]|nr:hypothetical protein [Planctomycetota bacterium]